MNDSSRPTEVIPPRPPLPQRPPVAPQNRMPVAAPTGWPERPAPPAPGASVAKAPIWKRLSTWIIVYGVALALIAFWPQPVDGGAGRLLRWVTRVFPIATYERIEFGSNILLFVPFGIGLALLVKQLRYLILPLALLASLGIESVQAILLAERTPSVYDIIANSAGACLGLIVVVVYEAWRDRRQTRDAADRQ